MAIAPEILRLARPPQEIIDLLFGRSRDGCYIALGSRRSDKHGDEAPRFFTVLPIRERQAFLPFISILPEQTKYIGVNTLRRSALKRGVSESEYLQALDDARPRFFKHRAHHIAELVAIFADLDVGKPHDDGHPPITGADAVAEVTRLALNGTIPYPSMLALSGTGAYALWCLRSRRGDHPPKHTTENAHLWRLVGGELHRVLDQALLYPDPRARARSQWMKAPGTIDTRTGSAVVFMPFYVPDPVTGRSSVALYSLPDLVGRLDLVSVDAPAPVRREIAAEIPPPPEGAGFSSRRYALPKTKHPPSPKDGTPSKAQAPFRARARDLELVAAERGGFKQGCRHFAALHYYGASWAFYRIKHPPQEAHRLACHALAEFNRRWCRPSLPAPEVDRMMRGKHTRAHYHTVMRDLGITDDEARRLDLRQLTPRTDREQREQARLERSGKLRARRGDVHRLILAGRTNAAIYAELPGVDRSQVCRIRKRLGFVDPKRRAHPAQEKIPAVGAHPLVAKLPTLSQRTLPPPIEVPERPPEFYEQRKRMLAEQARIILGSEKR